MKTMLALVASAAMALPVAARESQVRNQGAVRSHVWTSAAGLENARTSLRALTALANDATAWDAQHARDLVREAEGGVNFARTHERHLRAFTNSSKDAPKDLMRLDSDLLAAGSLLEQIRKPIAAGVGPDNDATQADNTMLGGAAAKRDLPPRKGDDVTIAANRGQRGGTREVQRLRSDLKAAWDKLTDAHDALDKVAGDLDASSKLPDP